MNYFGRRDGITASQKIITLYDATAVAMISPDTETTTETHPVIGVSYITATTQNPTERVPPAIANPERPTTIQPENREVARRDLDHFFFTREGRTARASNNRSSTPTGYTCAIKEAASRLITPFKLWASRQSRSPAFGAAR
jgi:hypothetical protein